MADLGRASAQYDYDQSRNDTVLAVKGSILRRISRTGEPSRSTGVPEPTRCPSEGCSSELPGWDDRKVRRASRGDSACRRKTGLDIGSEWRGYGKGTAQQYSRKGYQLARGSRRSGASALVDVDLAKCVDVACTNRPEIQSANTQVELTDGQVKIAAREGARLSLTSWGD